MADSGPSRRRGWILRVRVVPGNGLDSFGDLLGTRFQRSEQAHGDILETRRIQPRRREGPESAIIAPNGPPKLPEIY